MALKPLGDRVIVEIVDEPQTTLSGIVLPDTAKEKSQRGKVIAVGPGRVVGPAHDGGEVRDRHRAGHEGGHEAGDAAGDGGDDGAHGTGGGGGHEGGPQHPGEDLGGRRDAGRGVRRAQGGLRRSSQDVVGSGL